MRKFKLLFILCFSLILLFSGCELPSFLINTYTTSDESSTEEIDKTDSMNTTDEKNTTEEDTEENMADLDEIKGVWIATVFNIDFPSKNNLSKEEQISELDDIVKTAKSAGLNTILFQARPASDALYNSKLYPTSKYLTGEQGSGLTDGFDPLEYIIKAAHKEGLQLVAWVNPYRVTASQGETIDGLSEKNPAHIHPEWVVEYNEKLYFNPGIPEVRELVVNGIKEIVENYDVDGIHMDDYFYPYPASTEVDGVKSVMNFEDDEAYAEFNADQLELDCWRRENVNTLVRDCYNAIKKIDKSVHFGISPFGIWANSSHDADGSDTAGLESYFDIYCDPLAWAEGGYIDYICPQIYWAFSTKVAPFGVLCDWWDSKLASTGVKLLIGHAAYRVDTFESENEIIDQLNYAKDKKSYGGSVFYGYEQIKQNTLGLFDKIKVYYNK